MKVLVVGSGGREHALCWAIAASPLCDTLYCAPGNAGIAQVAECVPVTADDIPGVVGFCTGKGIDFVVVGPEVPLVLGLVDALDAAGVKAFGPRANAAVLEGSKGFTKDFCTRHKIPTAAYGRFDDEERADDFIVKTGTRLVIKADGLAAGKGVFMAATPDEARRANNAVFATSVSISGKPEVVIEEWLDGEEASFFALVDGEHAIALATAQDHKRVGDGDTGPNTGGMGAYSPAPVMTEALVEEVMSRIILPTVRGMKQEGRAFKGVLFAGLMITDKGPQLIEYNARFGDPECQVLMMRLKSDILPALIASADGQLEKFDLRWHDEPALTVVMAANGYPGDYRKGTEIRGLDEAGAIEGVQVFHAGTAAKDGKVLANGGRVLNVTAMGATVAEAQQRAYRAVDRIDWPEGFCRRDIGWRAIGR